MNPLRIESDLSDEHVLFLSDILPTDVVAVWGAGPVGQFAMDSAKVLGAAEVIAIDKESYRLRLAAQQGCTDDQLRRGTRPGPAPGADRRPRPTDRTRCGRPSWPAAAAGSSP